MDRGLAALATVCALPAVALSQDVTSAGEALSARAAKLSVIAAPDYPKPALSRGQTATIDVFVRVKADGTLTGWNFKAQPEEEPFAAALREVLPYWVALPRIDEATCRAQEDDMQVRVWFEIAEDKPKISVSQASSPAQNPAPDFFKGDSKMRVKTRRPVIYPREALRKGVEGHVQAVLRVESSGAVSNVEVRPGLHRAWFESAVLTALSRWEFEVSPDFLQGKPHVCAELDITFKIDDDSTLNRIERENNLPKLPRRVQ